MITLKDRGIESKLVEGKGLVEVFNHFGILPKYKFLSAAQPLTQTPISQVQVQPQIQTTEGLLKNISSICETLFVKSFAKHYKNKNPYGSIFMKYQKTPFPHQIVMEKDWDRPYGVLAMEYIYSLRHLLYKLHVKHNIEKQVINYVNFVKNSSTPSPPLMPKTIDQNYFVNQMAFQDVILFCIDVVDFDVTFILDPAQYSKTHGIEIDAFYSPVRKKIFIREKNKINEVTLAHELIHAFAHDNFNDYIVDLSFFKITSGPNAHDFIEGLTEAISSKVVDEINNIRTSNGLTALLPSSTYQKQRKYGEHFINTIGEPEVYEAYFGGYISYNNSPLNNFKIGINNNQNWNYNFP